MHVHTFYGNWSLGACVSEVWCPCWCQHIRFAITSEMCSCVRVQVWFTSCHAVTHTNRSAVITKLRTNCLNACGGWGVYTVSRPSPPLFPCQLHAHTHTHRWTRRNTHTQKHPQKLKYTPHLLNPVWKLWHPQASSNPQNSLSHTHTHTHTHTDTVRRKWLLWRVYQLL